MLAPVVVFVYNRPDHTEKTIESLAKNHLARETEVFIYADGAKNEKSIEPVQLVRDYIDSLHERSLFKSIHIIKVASNKGLANSVIDGVSEVVNQHEKVIVVEDDLVSSTDFLQYMNEALDYYEENRRIWSISGYSVNITIPKNYINDIYVTNRGCSWGYATWKDRWERVDWEVADYKRFKIDRKLRRRLNRGGRDMANMLDLQMRGELNSWAIRWCYTQSKLNMLTIYPVHSRIRNIGLDGTGTHSGEDTYCDVILADNKKCKFEDIELDRRIVKAFRKYYIPTPQYLIITIKYEIKKILGIL
ncbi:MAG: glycosyltransferase [Spirochaetales bacterium]|nr:glycosyltransferase [Spirochaetales bacterium]